MNTLQLDQLASSINFFALFIYLFIYLGVRRNGAEFTLICEAEKKKKENEILYSSAEKSHTLIAQVVKQAITKKYSGQKKTIQIS